MDITIPKIPEVVGPNTAREQRLYLERLEMRVQQLERERAAQAKRIENLIDILVKQRLIYKTQEDC